MSHIVIAGLGNPGHEYHRTRHNAGFMVLERFSTETGILLGKKKFNSVMGEGEYGGHRLLLLEPQTFMNRSGFAVAEALRFHKVAPADLVVVHDELDIPFGEIRLKSGGGHGGHNGIRSIAEQLGSSDFLRIRVGIGKPLRGDTSSWVLSPFSVEETASLGKVLDGGAEILTALLRDGVRKTMSLYNCRNFINPVPAGKEK